MEQIIDRVNIHKISWADDEMKLYFKSGAVVKYKGVPEGIAVGAVHAPSLGSFIRLYVRDKYECEVIKRADIDEENKSLMHHKDTTVGLWATDRPEMIPEDIKRLFFQIEYKDATIS